MNYYDILEEKAKADFEQFMNFIRNDKNLLYDITETENGETEIEVSVFDDNMCIDFIGSFAFNDNGEYQN